MDQNQGHQEKTHSPTHRSSVLVKTHYVINSYITTYAVEEFMVLII